MSPIDWLALEAQTGCSRARYYDVRANALLVEGQRLVAGYLASRRRRSLARRLAYTEGVARPPRRLTRAQEQLRDAQAFGLMRGAA